MRILIVAENVEERKSLEHLLISNGFDNFHSIHPNDEIRLYLEKIVYKLVIIIGEAFSKDDVLNLASKFSKPTAIISITKDSSVSENIVPFLISKNYQEKLIEYLQTQIVNKHLSKEDLLIKINDKYKRIRLEAIEYIKADGKYVSLHLDKRKYSLRNTLKGVALMLPDYFVRSHSSFIVNINKIESIHIIEQNIELLNSNIPFSRKYKGDLLNRFHLG